MTLQALDRQEQLGGNFEVIVVDDGSDDGTLEMLRRATFSGFDLKVVALEHGGPARARNRGTAQAAADRVLLLGDDMIPEPDCIAAHLARGQEAAVQGMIDWDPAVGITDVMRFLAPEGPQFWFKGLGEGSAVPWTSVVSSNLSAPTAWFVKEPFDEGFPEACFEDTELAWRWHRRNWCVRFQSSALCLHHHRYDSIEPFLKRQRRAGRWARRGLRLHRRLLFETFVRPIALSPALGARAVWRKLIGRGRRDDVWDLKCRAEFVRGFFLARTDG